MTVCKLAMNEYKRQNLVLKSVSRTAEVKLEDNMWKQYPSFMQKGNRLWLPINLPEPSRSALTIYNEFNFIAEVYWFRKPEDDVPVYYWIEFKNGHGKCNYLPKSIREMLDNFQDLYGYPSTKGVVYKVGLDCFSFKDTRGEHFWYLYEDKIIKKYKFQVTTWNYNKKTCKFTFK